ncbi:unnamed protein product [Paramecium octaurelia]|uniref:Uncharacterized protein n=1 Tax=Paramecium octaurelia TaxID=43137 RepID=A0A8S1SEF9_PAROT|nr:unnamed protein product [Paramecium octaurelia]
MQTDKQFVTFSQSDSSILHQLLNYFQDVFEQLENEFNFNLDQIRFPVLSLLDSLEKEDYIQSQHQIDGIDKDSYHDHKTQIWEQMKRTCLSIIIEKKTQVEFELSSKIKSKEKIFNLLIGTSQEKYGSKILTGPTCLGIKHGNFYFVNKDGLKEKAGMMYLNFEINTWIFSGRYIQLYKSLRKNFIVIFQMGKIVYVDDGEIIAENKADVLDNSSSWVLFNLDQIYQLKWHGNYGSNGKKIGKWKPSLEAQQITNAGGNYEANGVKTGQWIELYQDYTKISKAYFVGQYKDGLKQGKWNAYQNNKIIGGGSYDENGAKYGNWVEIVENFLGLNYLKYEGQYDGGKKRGLWKANYNQKTINLGCYDENGLKNGKWVNLYKFFNPSCRVIFIGQYNNGMKIGQWTIQQRKIIIGGGMYNDEGKKIGVWKELQPNFQLDFEVFYTGLYEEGIKQGEWKIYFQDRLIGGGNYDSQGMKHGLWKDAHQNFSYRIQVAYSGEYVKGWKKGRWNIMLIDQIIGGGNYDEGIKQGKWIEVDEKYADYHQVLCVGEYSNGMKIGRWDFLFQGNVIGGGQYEDGMKHGKWTILDSKWNRQLFIIKLDIINSFNRFVLKMV